MKFSFSKLKSYETQPDSLKTASSKSFTITNESHERLSNCFTTLRVRLELTLVTKG